jgi:hypothetical protein
VDNRRAQKSFAAAGFRAVERGRRYTPEVGEFEGMQMEVTRADFLELEFSGNSMSGEG